MGDVWTWDVDNPAHPTIEHLGLMSLSAAQAYAKYHDYQFFGRDG
jgi:hypothetical protein